SLYVSESFVIRLSTTLLREVRRDARKKAALATGKLASRQRTFSRLCSVSVGKSMVCSMSLAQRALYLLIYKGRSFLVVHHIMRMDFTSKCMLVVIFWS